MSEPLLTPEQEDALQEWAYANPPEMTAEEAKIENVVASIEILIKGAKETIEGIDALAELNLGGDMSALRAALEDVLAKWQPATPEWGEP